MPISFTDKYNLDKNDFLETGAFDIILDVDSRFFIDPVLLDKCDIKEFKDAKEKVKKYFSDIITLLSYSKNSKDMYWKKADRLLTFSELKGTCCGYSNDGTDGNSIGPVLRNYILNTIKELIDVGENNPSIFELLGVFQEGIGCDRISDLLTFILAPEIYSYTQRIMKRFNLANNEVEYNNIKYLTRLNEYNNKPILLLPTSMLSPLPVADSFDDIDDICTENERVRNEINAYLDLGKRKKLSKNEIFSLMKTNPSFRNALLTAYKNIDLQPYDFERDPAGEYSWYRTAQEYVTKYPLEINLPKNPTLIDMYSIIEKMCVHFKTLIEDNGLWNLLYTDDKKAKHERASQLLFFGVADAYCIANNIDLSREVNNGRGPIDFKLSKGAKDKILIEVKLTSNGQLQHGFDKQLPIYMKQENTKKAIYLIIDNGHEKALKNFMKMYNQQSTEVKKKISCIIIDGTPQKSASTA